MSGQILATVAAEDFIGRTRELDTLWQHAKGETANHGLFLFSAPSVGTSELLKQIYDRLFLNQTETIPFYFALKKSDKTAKQAAIRFLQDFLQQTVAFRRKDARILRSSPDVCELAELAIPSDGYWIDRLVANCQTESQLSDERAFVRNYLSAPLRAFSGGAKSLVMVNDLHEAEYFTGEIDFVEELKEIFAQSDVQFVFAGNRRFLFGSIPSAKSERLELKTLSFNDAGLLAENLSEKLAVKINEQTRDLIAAQFDGNPTFIRFMIQAAAAKKVDLDSFQQVEKIYADELFGGKTGKFYDTIFDEIAPNIETQKHLLGLIYDALTIEKEKTPIESWQFRTNLNDADFYRIMRLLNSHEIIRVTSNLVEGMSENEILTDYIKARFRLESIAEPRALVIGEMLSEFLKRAPKTMARFYRRNSAIGLRELLSVFNRQETPENLLDYSIFKDELKGAPTDEILKITAGESTKIRLPQIAYTAHTVAFYPPINQVSETERSAVALGFQECNYTDDDEIVWIAAEIEAKFEASKELTEFWCDRLEMVALMCNFLNYKLWLVAPEGFSPDAIKILKQRNGYGSSRKQVEVLIKFLQAETIVGEKRTENEYEMIVPMGEDTELIAAHAIEEIARRHHFAPKAINQIKTALVEACINAAEHSHSPDRKIYQKFSIEKDKIIITISNRGLRLADKKTQELKPDEGRRGWGLKLIQSLMDEVKFEQVDDGTRISMVKYL